MNKRHYKPSTTIVKTSASHQVRGTNSRKDALIVLAKYPRPGIVKTRLGVWLGDETASKIAEVFLVDLLNRFATSGLRIVITGAQSDTATEFSSLCKRYNVAIKDLEVFVPGMGSMRADMLAAYEYVLKDSAKAVLTAPDIPYLSVRMIDDLLVALDSHDLVFHPTVDGATTPIGMKRPIDLFTNIDSGKLIIRQRFDRIKRWRISYKVFPPVFDIDEPKDLEVFYYWQLLLKQSHNMDAFCAKTMGFLQNEFVRRAITDALHREGHSGPGKK